MAFQQFECDFRSSSMHKLHERVDAWLQEQKARSKALGVPFVVHGMLGTHMNAEHNYMVTVFYDGAPITLTRQVEPVRSGIDITI